MRELVKAGALIAAEIDRLQRLRPNKNYVSSQQQGSNHEKSD